MRTLGQGHESYREVALGRLIAIKEAEVTFYIDLLKPEKFLPAFWTKLEEVKATGIKANQVPQLSADGRNVIGWVTSKVWQSTYDALALDLPHLCNRVIRLEGVKQEYIWEKGERKKALKKAADVEMGDATSEAQRISDLVNKAVAKRLAKKEGNAGKGKQPAKERKKKTSAGSSQKKDAAKDAGKRKAKAASTGGKGHKRKASRDQGGPSKKTRQN
ncbi:hypothetical protein F5J12DRAFT_895739 [Pisolithus orientalis]|uniref:uncharacterized protein n=1 Tax=Pisolithus orientalis TaxID=936130 RepID=UPI002223FBA6|nr:uncharacterized protein F5J12DRAFT_895739 [Pisolithus orientalis]KAI5997607.1 hypothetical protein F5J12DRAFT_895739 [Pisolithus orientalis]